MDHAASRCFLPAVTPDIKLLVLGSLPGGQSLAKAQYYGHPRNQFWRLTGAVIGVDLATLDYASRLATLNANGVGLWDVVAQAIRPGSLDQNMREVRPNELTSFIAQFRELKAIGFNGSTASRIGRRQLESTPAAALSQPLELIDLPSSSPAHTMRFESKRAVWMRLQPFVGRAE